MQDKSSEGGEIEDSNISKNLYIRDEAVQLSPSRACILLKRGSHDERTVRTNGPVAGGDQAAVS